MNYNQYLKGSEWRKWDLHIHSPASFHWNGGNMFREMTDQDKEDALSQMYQTIQNSDIAAFCLMDYWTFDGYFLFRDYLKRRNLSLDKLLLPGMELRIEAPVDYRLNIHVILSDKLTNQQLIDLRSKLMIRSINRTISDEALIQFANSLGADKAKKHGFGDPATLSKDNLLKLGAYTAEVTQDSLSVAIKSLPHDTCLIFMPFDTSDGLKDLNWATHPQADNYFMQSSHIFESRNQESIDLFHGVKTEANKSFIHNFQKTLGNVPKPVVCGSDAHRFADYGNFPNDKITWIKADPTFEGIKQILYEPRERVRIQPHFPGEKTPYLLIDHVKFIEKTTKRRFASDWIELNRDLNVIIGGKSSGKSILLYHIAKSIDLNETDHKINDVHGLTYNFGDSSAFDFIVRWNDGLENSIHESAEQKTRELTFLPQMYINHLVDDKGRTGLTELIESILEQNSQYKTFHEVIQENVRTLEINIKSDINELIGLREHVKELLDKKKVIGDDKAIQTEIKRLSAEIEKLTKESGFTETDKKEFDSLTKSYEHNDKKQKEYQSLKDNVLNYKVFLSTLSVQIADAVDTKTENYTFDPLSQKFITYLADQTKLGVQNVLLGSVQICDNYLSKFTEKIEKHGRQIETINKDFKPYNLKIKNRVLLKELEEKRELEKSKLQNYLSLTREIEAVTEKDKRTRESLLKNYQQLFNDYQKIVHELKKDDLSKIDKLELKATLNFDIDIFSTNFSDLFDRRITFVKTFGNFFDNSNEYIFTETAHLANVQSIFSTLSKIDNEEIRFKKGITPNHALTKLFDNYFTIDYSIQHNGEDILQMSPGKRGLVLLELILHISNATHPILIDQPEDNLDNRTIYNELKDFIKERKHKRQIILVTHNANLLVGTDAENVIVCNQDGQQVGKDNMEFQFEYVSGAFEHSFIDESKQGVLYKFGIKEHICDILEGGRDAFLKRERKYGFNKWLA